MTNDVPRILIKHQSQISLPVTGDATLVDDAVALVDSSSALVGGLSVTAANVPVAIDNKPPQVIIKRRR